MKCARIAHVAALAGIAVTFLAVQASLNADEKLIANETKGEPNKLPSWREKLDTILSQRVSLEFRDTRLNDAVEQIRRKHKVNILFDSKNLADANVNVDEVTVSLQANDLSLSDVLQLLLRGRGLTFVPQDEVLLITTKEQADSRVESRVYDVTDLVPSEGGEFDYEPLIAVITNTIATQTWPGESGPSRIGTLHGCLIIEQTSTVHENIVGFLDMLRSVRKQQMSGTFDVVAQWPPRSAKLAKLLARKTSSSFQEVSLKEVVEELQRSTGINFVFDPVFYDSGLDPLQLPITIEVTDVSVHAALNLICRSQHLSWYSKGDVVIISTQESECGGQIKVYPVADLVGPHSLIDAEKKLGHASADAYVLADAVSDNVGAESWSNRGGVGVIGVFDDEYPMLVVLQSREVHQSIEELLAKLRNARSEQVAEFAKLASVPAKPEVPVLCVYHLKSSTPTGSTMTPREVVRTVKDLIAPDAWMQEGAYIQGVTGRLIVRQTPEVHREIVKLLMDLEVLRGGGIKLPTSVRQKF